MYPLRGYILAPPKWLMHLVMQGKNYFLPQSQYADGAFKAINAMETLKWDVTPLLVTLVQMDMKVEIEIGM